MKYLPALISRVETSVTTTGSRGLLPSVGSTDNLSYSFGLHVAGLGALLA
jgi:hypothetical protein